MKEDDRKARTLLISDGGNVQKRQEVTWDWDWGLGMISQEREVMNKF